MKLDMQDLQTMMRIAKSALLGLAVGDALGVPVEFMSRKKVRRVNLTEMIGKDTPLPFESRWGDLIPAGAWSDDTSMAVATMESMIAQGGEIDYDDVMTQFVNWWEGGKYCSLSFPFGLGSTISKAMDNYRAGFPAVECGPKGVWDNGNGALMRILPFSLYCIIIMKKLICTLTVLALLLCGLAMAEGKTVNPMVSQIDLTAPDDGIYGVAFGPADLADGALKFTIYTEDCYDIVDINTLEVGDVIRAGGIDIGIDSLEAKDGDLLINGGIGEAGFNLRPYDEDNCWKMALEDDCATWTEAGETTLPLADDVTFTDSWDIEKEPVTVSGAEAVAEAVNGTEMDSFICLNTKVRVEDGKIVEIIRAYMP